MAKAKVRKMLGAADSPYIVSLMRIIETQSKETLTRWCVEYAETNYLPLCPRDERPKAALDAARGWLAGAVKPAEVKKAVNAVTDLARGLDGDPAAQAAVRAVGQAAGCLYTPTHSLGMAFYGAAAVAYVREGLEKTAEEYDLLAAAECAKLEAALRGIAVENEPKPAKINWGC